ncbi:hypothetical protein [Rhizobium sp. BE258]|uniref:hypothetical protein n=1 Tax=Rhizobium sp. BE258 TaxID=2817722 RepID=UPI0028620DAD|nr:hypothetical protein [Rhizobium sp. BE258]MDR7145133.1 hypothetical protein [Rhizobium sp. BE258]
MKAELLRLAQAHERSLSRVIDVRDRVRLGTATDTALEPLLADEAKKRAEFIYWEPPSASLAVDKLLRLLAHCLAGGLAFDDAELFGIRNQVQRLRSSTPPNQGSEPIEVEDGTRDIG